MGSFQKQVNFGLFTGTPPLTPAGLLDVDEDWELYTVARGYGFDSLTGRDRRHRTTAGYTDVERSFCFTATPRTWYMDVPVGRHKVLIRYGDPGFEQTHQIKVQGVVVVVGVTAAGEVAVYNGYFEAPTGQLEVEFGNGVDSTTLCEVSVLAELAEAPEREDSKTFVRPRRDQDPFYEETRGRLERGDIFITIEDPEGIVLDVSDRLLDDFPATEEVVEIDLLELAHGDTELTLDDKDLAVSKFLTGAREGEEWKTVICRRVYRRRQKFEPVFSGVLDLPWSLETDEDERTVTIQIFSFSKVLENTSAEIVKRTFATLAGTTTAANPLLTLTTGTTADLEIGDTVAVDDDAVREENEVLQINSSTSVTCRNFWANSFTAKPVEVTTPFYRDKSIAFLVGELFEAAGITSYEIDVRNPVNNLLFPSPMSRNGLKSGHADHLLDRDGIIAFNRTGDTTALGAASPSAGWASVDTLNGKIDWRPNTASEPGTIEDQASANDHNLTADQASGFSYNLAYYPGSDQLWIQRDGVDLVQVEAGLVLDLATSGAILGPWTQDDYVWYSFRDDSGNKALKYRDIGGATTTTVSSGASSSEWFGHVQNIRALGITVFKPHHQIDFANSDTDQLHVYPDPVDGDPPTLLGKVTVPRRLHIPSLRGYNYPRIGNIVAGIYYTGEATKMRIWRLDTLLDWVQISDFTLRGTDTEKVFGTPTRNYLTIFEHAREDPLNSETVFLAAIENEDAPDVVSELAPFMFVISTQFIGVVPYADFDGMSVGKALKELALMTMSFLRVDHNRIGRFIGRAQNQEERDAPPIELDTPLRRRRRVLWEFFRDSVEVKGEAADGSSVEAVAGDTGASAKRLSLSSSFVTSEALAYGIASQYLGYLNQRRTEEEITIREPDQVIEPLGKVFLDGRTYMVTEKRHNYLDREMELRIFELEE